VIRPVVFVARRVPASVLAALDERFEVALHDSDAPPARVELLAGVAGARGLVSMLTDVVDDELLGRAPHLGVVANYAVGVDNVDVGAASARDVVVANTPDVLTEATAELTLALLLALLRRVAEGDRLLRRRTPWTWAPTFLLGSGLAGKTLGIVGLGRIGSAVARLGEAHGMHVLHASRSERPEARWPRVALPELLARSDAVSLHVPLTDETRHLVGRAELAAMKPAAVLVNTARGPLVDEAALAGALRAGAIAGAALDVYEHEPDVHPLLLDLENVVLAPHLGSATDEARVAMGMLCVRALEAVLLDRRLPENAVNADAVRV
jgi:glyoxylate reductase